MPTEKEIKEAGSLSPDDPQVQTALERMSRGMQHVVMRLVQHAHRTAAGKQPEEWPPEDKERGAPRTTEGRPATISNTDSTRPTKSRKPPCLASS
jgi:hypothetical protein